MADPNVLYWSQQKSTKKITTLNPIMRDQNIYIFYVFLEVCTPSTDFPTAAIFFQKIVFA